MPLTPQQLLDRTMKKWHEFFARAIFPLILSDRDHAQLGIGLSYKNPGGPELSNMTFLIPGGTLNNVFQFIAVDPDDYTKGYKIKAGNIYAGYMYGYFGLMNVDCLRMTGDPTEASVYGIVLTGPMTFQIQELDTGRVLTRMWDNITGYSLWPRQAISLEEIGIALPAIQQEFAMPMWPFRMQRMAYVSPNLNFCLQSGDNMLYANGDVLAWGQPTDKTTAIVTATSPDLFTIHSGYVLSVGGKYLKLTTTGSAISLVSEMADATALCVIDNEDGTYCIWECMGDNVLSLNGMLPVFILCDEMTTTPPVWTVGSSPGNGMFRLFATADRTSLETTRYLKAIVEKLSAENLTDKRALWNYSFNNLFPFNWFIQTPEKAFGNYSDFEMPVPAEGANDFNLQTCAGSTDAKHPCVQLASSANTPRETPLKFNAGHSRTIYEEMYKTIISGDNFIDIMSLLRNTATPSGEFLAAVRNAITFLSRQPSSQNITIRLLFGEPLGWFGDKGWLPGTGPYRPAGELLRDLTRDIPSTTTSKMKIYLAYTSSVPWRTWNHAKVIAADGQQALVGGHNMWAEPYLGSNPVLDVSMMVTGLAAVDAHHFADKIWFQQVVSHGDYWAVDAASFTAPSTYDSGQAAVANTRLFESFYQEPANAPGRDSGNGTPVLSVGRAEGTPAGEAPSDKALVKMIDLATENIYISAQALSHAPIRFSNWPADFLDALAAAVARGVSITIFMSDPSDGSYKGDPPADVIRQIENRITGKSGSEIISLMTKLSVRSFPPATLWGFSGKPGISNHAKVIMIDKTLFSIGSQNFYPSNPASMSEFTYIVEDGNLATEMYTNYFKALEGWALPSANTPALSSSPKYRVELEGLRCVHPSGDAVGSGARPDDTYLTLDGKKFWPSGRYQNMPMGSDADIGPPLMLTPMSVDDSPRILKVYDWDIFGDDFLGEITFHPDSNIAIVDGSGNYRYMKLPDLQPHTTYTANFAMSDDEAKYQVRFNVALVT